MENDFSQAADPFEGLRQAIEMHAKTHPDSKIRDVQTALQHMNAVFVSQGATRLEEFGTDIPNSRYHVGLSCGDGRDTFFVDAGHSRERAERVARHLCWHNADLKVLAERPPQPFIALNPHRIRDVFDDRGNMIFIISDSPHAFSVAYVDDHRASIDSFLLHNKVIQARFGNVRLERPQAQASVDGKVIALPFRSRHKPATPT